MDPYFPNTHRHRRSPDYETGQSQNMPKRRRRAVDVHAGRAFSQHEQAMLSSGECELITPDETAKEIIQETT